MSNAYLCISFLGHCRMVIVYCSASIYLFGHNNQLNELRWLTSIELYENAKFYCQHPVLLECLKAHSRFYSNFNSICSCCCLYKKSFNSFVSTDIVKSVKDKAISNLKNGQYCSFLCILAFSTITGTQINCIYPSVGQKKYRLLFNNIIKPSQCYSSSVNHVTTPISIMFSRIGVNENCVSNYLYLIILYPPFKKVVKF